MTDIVERLKAYELFGSSVAVTQEAATCIESLRTKIAALTKERDEIVGANMLNRNALKISHAKLAAAQAQILQLRDALEKLLPYAKRIE